MRLRPSARFCLPTPRPPVQAIIGGRRVRHAKRTARNGRRRAEGPRGPLGGPLTCTRATATAPCLHRRPDRRADRHHRGRNAGRPTPHHCCTPVRQHPRCGAREERGASGVAGLSISARRGSLARRRGCSGGARARRWGAARHARVRHRRVGTTRSASTNTSPGFPLPTPLAHARSAAACPDSRAQPFYARATPVVERSATGPGARRGGGFR